MKNAVMEGKPYEAAKALRDHLAKYPSCTVEI
jgi:hypothetical protein